MLLLVYAVVSAPQAGWAAPRTLVSFAVAIALLGAFIAVERRSRDPLVRLGIFRSAQLTRANLAAMVLFGSYVSFQFLVTQYLQIGLSGHPAHRRASLRAAQVPLIPRWLKAKS